MKYIIFLFLIIDVILIISTFISSIVFKAYQKKINNITKGFEKNKKIYILLPAYKEQNIVKETLEHFSKIAISDCKIVVITSEKEEYANERYGRNIKTTAKCVEEYKRMKGNDSIIHLHCPYIEGTKSTQLNYAIQKIKAKLSSDEISQCYIGVYDFDSRPNLSVLTDVCKAVSLYDYPEVIQQVPINLKNLHDITKNKNDMMMLHCCQSNIRTVGIELAKLLLHSCNIFVPLYCMGAGMYLRLDTLIDSGMFPEPVDDLTLGYKLYLSKKRFVALPKYNYVDLPDSVKALVNQDRLIFIGVCSGINELRCKAKAIRKILMFFSVLHNIMLRTIIPWVYLIYAAWCLFYVNVDFVTVCILTLPFIRTIIGAYATIMADNKNKTCIMTLTFVKALLFSYSWRFIRTLGAFNIIFNKIFNKKIVFMKTERK